MAQEIFDGEAVSYAGEQADRRRKQAAGAIKSARKKIMAWGVDQHAAAMIIRNRGFEDMLRAQLF